MPPIVPTVVTFGPGGRNPVGDYRIYTRDSWSDEWTEIEYLDLLDVTWCCGPSIPTTTLRWNYGYIRQRGVRAFTAVERLDWTWPKFLKIVIDCEYDTELETWSSRTWHGILEITSESLDGIVLDGTDAIETGTQVFHAFGLESLLARCRIDRTYHQAADSDTKYEVLARVPFNQSGRPNRNNTYQPDGCYLFGQKIVDQKWWSTKTILDYLLTYFTPRDYTEVIPPTLVFTQASGSILPTWDRHEIEVTDATTLSVLQRLVTRQRLLGYWFEVNGDDEVELNSCTFLVSDLDVTINGSTETIPANASQLHLKFDTDQETACAFKDDRSQTYDMVTVTAGEEVYVGTFSVQDSTLKKSWTTSQESTYETGASALTGWADLSDDEKEQLNNDVRSSPQLEDVFCTFEIPENWNQKVGDGVNGVVVGSRDRFFRNDVESIDAYLPATFFEPSLPLASGVNYAGTRIADYADGALASLGEPDMSGETETLIPWLAPMVFVARPNSDPTSWCRGEHLANSVGVTSTYDEVKFSITANVPAKTRKVQFRVSGGPQHSIAAGTFSGNDGDDDTAARLDFSNDFLVTLAAKCGVRLLAETPVTPPTGLELVRRLVIDSGLPYHLVTVANHTVVDVAADGTLKRSTGGRFCRPKDGLERLQALADIAHAWYSVPHQSISLTTTRLQGDDKLNLGDLIAKIGDDTDSTSTHLRDINSVITEIRIEWPVGSADGPPPAPTMTIQTSSSELDPLALGAVFSGKHNPFERGKTVRA